MDFTVGKYFKGDRVIWAVLLLLSILSLLIVYSSTGALAYRVASGNTMHYLIRQIVFLGLGIIVIVFMVNVIPVKFYSIAANYLLYLSIGLLAFSVVMKGTGMIDGSGRTITFFGISFQPAEFAKISLILYSAKVLGKKQSTNKDLFQAFKKIIIFTMVVCGLIFLSDFSTSVLLFATIMTMMFIGRIPIKYLLSVVVVGVSFIALIYFTADKMPSSFARVHTVKARMERFIFPVPHEDKGITQADYAKLAIYSGGTFGRGPGNSDVSNYMAAAYNDFIFAIIVEEYGLIFGAGVIFLYLIFFYRGVVIVKRSTRTFPAFMVTGLTLILVYQAMINIGVSSGALPVTGQPLPWVSLGGTSLLFTSIAFGCILSASYQTQKDRQIEEQPVQIVAPDEDYEMEK